MLGDFFHSLKFKKFFIFTHKVAGSNFAAYIGFGIPANHLLIASLMSSPAALAISKVIYPETEKTKANSDAIKNLPTGYLFRFRRF